jgi:predicted HicB family RNase H-like nuclease
MSQDEQHQEREEQSGKPVSFRAPPALARRIELEAGRELLSVSAFVRRAVLQSLALSAPEGL